MDTDKVSHTPDVKSREDAVVLSFNRKEAKAFQMLCLAYHANLQHGWGSGMQHDNSFWVGRENMKGEYYKQAAKVSHIY
jgi:hypothetical protein